MIVLIITLPVCLNLYVNQILTFAFILCLSFQLLLRLFLPVLVK